MFRSRSQRLESFLSFCVVVATFTFEVSGQKMGGDGFQTHKRKPGFQDRFARSKCWRMPSQLTSERSGFASSVPRLMFGRGGDADDATLTSPSGSSSSSGEEGQRPRDQGAKLKDLRAQVEQLWRQQRVEKGQGVQGVSTRRESGLEEVDNKKLDELRERLQKQLREIDKFSDMDQMF